MIQAYGLVDLLDQDALDTLEIPVTWIFTKRKLPARIIVDMTDVMDELYQSLRENNYSVIFIILNWCITDMIMWDRFRFLKM